MAGDDKDFPVIFETELPKARKRILLPDVREPDGLPVQRPGTTLVFNNGKKWVQARGRIKGTEEFVVDATEVSVVRTRERVVDVDVKIPSKDLAEDFGVLVGFSCKVTKPDLVAEQGPIDIVDRLRRYLLEDRKLRQRGTEYTVDELHQVRHQVEVRVRSYCDEVPPSIPGLEIRLSSVDVLTSADLLAHKKRMRDAQWNDEFTTLTSGHEDIQVRRLSTFLSDPASAAAFAFLREKIDMEKIVTAAYADRRTQDENLLEFLKLLERNGKIDLLPVDARILVTRLLDRLGGTGGPVRVDATIGGAGAAVTMDAEARTSIDASSSPADDDRFTVGDNP
jgi:hypothetical protein